MDVRGGERESDVLCSESVVVYERRVGGVAVTEAKWGHVSSPLVAAMFVHGEQDPPPTAAV